MKYAGIKIKTEPTSEPVTSTEAKTQCAITGTPHDTLITSLIKAARQTVEKALRRTLINTTYQVYFDEFPSTLNNARFFADRLERSEKNTLAFELPYPPVSSIVSITYTDVNGTSQPFTNYTSDLISIPPRILPAWGYSWPSARDTLNAVCIEYIAGYGANYTFVPEPIRQAILMLISEMFEHREINSEISLQNNPIYERLIGAYKIPELA